MTWLVAVLLVIVVAQAWLTHMLGRSLLTLVGCWYDLRDETAKMVLTQQDRARWHEVIDAHERLFEARKIRMDPEDKVHMYTWYPAKAAE
jgi:hypothetical protein